MQTHEPPIRSHRTPFRLTIACAVLAAAPAAMAQAVNSSLSTKDVASVNAGGVVVSSQPNENASAGLSLSATGPAPLAVTRAASAQLLSPTRAWFQQSCFAAPNPGGALPVASTGLGTPQTTDFRMVIRSDGAPVMGPLKLRVRGTALGDAAGNTKLFLNNSVTTFPPTGVDQVVDLPMTAVTAQGFPIEISFGGVAAPLSGSTASITQEVEIEFVPDNTATNRCTALPGQVRCVEGGLLLATPQVSGSQEILETRIAGGPSNGFAFAVASRFGNLVPLAPSLPAFPGCRGLLLFDLVQPYGRLDGTGSASRNFSLGSLTGNFQVQVISVGTQGLLAASNTLLVQCN